MPQDPIVIVAARDEEQRLPVTLAALRRAFPGARVLVADDGSTDATARVAVAAGAEVCSTGRAQGKGGACSLAAARVLAQTTVPDPPVVLLCDGDLGDSAARLAALVDAVRAGAGDVVVAAFAHRTGGGFGIAVGAARRMLRDLCGLELHAPISGQRALRGEALACVTPFAARFGMEIGLTADAVRAGFGVVEVELDLEHRATGRTVGGFVHRARQLRDFVAVWWSRR